MRQNFSESTAEEAALEWLRGLGYEVRFGPEIAPEEPRAERTEFEQIVLEGRLREAIGKINSEIPEEAREEAVRKVLRTEHPSLTENNRRFHKFLTDGVPVEYQAEGRTVHDQVWLADFENLDNNDWLAVNQFTVIENRHDRRPDVVIFINGLPLGVIELKNPADENATIRNAFNQLQTYKAQITSLFTYNEALIISDGIEARMGSVTSDWDRFMPWRTVDGKDLAPTGLPQLEVLLKGVFDKRRFLDIVRHFVVFEETPGGVAKKIAGYHQFHAVEKAVESTLAATRGDRRVGIVWHTQGSGKSLTMVFYAGKIAQHPEMKNPTLVVLTDRNDLDNQLFDTFSGCGEVLRQTPVQAENRERLQELLKVASGGVVFTTIQKFFPEEKGDKFPSLSARRNIVVIADEAHRSQYDFIDGFAKHMRDALPGASFIGFTATPIAKTDRNTTAVFGNYIDVYDIHRSIEDKATVPIYYEARLAKLGLKEEEKPRIDPEFEEVTEGEEEPERRRLQTKWSRLEALVGSKRRIELVAQDIVNHFERRLEAMEGKGLIVCMSRRICVQLYQAIMKLRPQWHNSEDDQGFIKVVMTGAPADPVDWQEHIRNKERRRAIGDTFKKPASPIKLVIVRDMWLTGFDVPCLHTMYLDKPMRGHGLMQAIARVNRVFKDKPGGLVVDYLGIAQELKKALADYSNKDREKAGIDQEVAVTALFEKYEVLKSMFHGFNYSEFFKGAPQRRLQVMAESMEHVLKVKDGKERFMAVVTQLSQAFALAVPHEKALALREEIAFFQAIRAALAKSAGADGPDVKKDRLEVESAIQQIVSKAISSDGVVDIFKATGLKKPDISILSDEFLEEIRGMPYKNLALELLKKLLSQEIKLRERKFLVQSRSFAEMLEKSVREYHNRTIEAAQVIEAMIRLAKEMREAHRRGEKMGLGEDELAFYDALEVNDSAVKELGDKTLQAIARDLVQIVRQNTTIDWTVKESVRANLRRLIKRLLNKHGYPPDKQEKAVKTVLEQAELIGKDWS
ncbi:MAG: type I restriction endonuclease subunit R [Elusimicrobia bacterium]|nr:type I restriction endonuclease subunit R [Elusimicrobiota bacterium]